MTRGNLLIVDDEPVLLKRLEGILGEYADRVFLANDGVEALDVLAREEVHCVICDVNMPRMNGVEVIKKIRASENSVPFIFYTGHGNRELMIEAASYGAFDFLNKPDFDGLEEVIKRGLQEGFTSPPQDREEQERFLSEYQKLVSELQQK